MSIEKLLQFIQNDAVEAAEHLANGNLEMVYRLCECITEQAGEIRQLIAKQEKGE